MLIYARFDQLIVIIIIVIITLVVVSLFAQIAKYSVENTGKRLSPTTRTYIIMPVFVKIIIKVRCLVTQNWLKP